MGKTCALDKVFFTLLWMLVPASVTSVIHQLAALDLDEAAIVLKIAISNHELFKRVSKAACASMTTGLVLFYTIAHPCLC